jgi:hypothetical protein
VLGSDDGKLKQDDPTRDSVPASGRQQDPAELGNAPAELPPVVPVNPADISAVFPPQ